MATNFHSPGPPSDKFRQRMRLAYARAGAVQPGSQLAARWAGTLLVIAFGQFAFFTLFPFNFTLHTGQVFDFHAVDPSDYSDWVLNVVLTLPVGFALGALAAGWGWTGRKTWKMLLLAAGVTCLCSSAVECLQLFLPGRDSALADILSNTTGGLVGCCCFLALGRDFLRLANYLSRLVRRGIVGPKAIGLLLAVIALVCAGPAYVLRRPRLVMWNANFPLLIGNENNVGDESARQWSGMLTGLHIANRAADPQQQVPQLLAHGNFAKIMGDSAIADYPLLGPGPYADASRHLPDLTWAWQDPAIPPGAPAHFSYRHYLSTSIPVAPLVKAITDTDTFTITFVYAADSLAQTGPARMLTCSKDIYTRNLTIGQENADLIVRLRTRGAGPNGISPQWRVPNFFRDLQSHRLLVTYDGDILRVFQDTPQHQWRVRTPPEYAMLRPILARDELTMPITGAGNRRIVVLFYCLCDLPIALVLGLILAGAVSPPSLGKQPPMPRRLILPVLGLLIAVTALYMTLDRLGVRAMGWTEFPLSAFILAIETAIFGHWWSRGPSRTRPDAPMAQVTHIGYAP